MRLLIEQTLNDKKVAILVADGFEKIELTEPKKAMAQKG
jgi:deglycase